MAKIGQKAKAQAIHLEQETNGIISIVRHGKGFNPHIAHLESGAGGKNLEIKFRLELLLDSILGEAIAINRNRNLFAKSAQAIGVVSMLVGKENASEVFGSAANLGQALANLPAAKTSINKQPGAGRFQIRAITIGTAA